MLWVQLPPKARCRTLRIKVLLKVENQPFKQPKTIPLIGMGITRKRRNRHKLPLFFYIYKILNGCNGLRLAYLYELVQPYLTRKPGHNLRNENITFHLPFSSSNMIMLFLSLSVT